MGTEKVSDENGLTTIWVVWHEYKNSQNSSSSTIIQSNSFLIRSTDKKPSLLVKCGVSNLFFDSWWGIRNWHDKHRVLK